jgi:hypothetical protein
VSYADAVPGHDLTITPAPTEAEAAAIVAALEAAWPKPVVAAHDTSVRGAGNWRFSGRWWSVPLPVRRDRPWR